MTGPSPLPTLDEFLAHAIAAGETTPEKARRLGAAVSESGHPVDVVMTELGIMTEEGLGQALARFLGTEFLADPGPRIDRDLLERLGRPFFESNCILPISGGDHGEVPVCVSTPFSDDGLKLLSYRLERPLRLLVSTRPVILAALAGFGAGEAAIADPLPPGGIELDAFDLERLRDVAQEAPVVRLIARVLQRAVDLQATDIHIEPMDRHVQIRLRIDGLLQTWESVPIDMLSGVATRIKILSRLNISERRLPQDGRMRAVIRGTEVDFRVSVLPSVNGETLVLRVLDRTQVALDLASLGFADDARASLAQLAHVANGIVLVTGPTGSGKTTTLYALLRMINSIGVKIFTVEDPVEYRMEGVTQLQVDPGIDLTFARALRSVLRQDPDIILVGEIRDRETAEIAMQAALTGHLVLSTLHTNSAVGAVTRLRDMGIDDYLIGATVKAAIGQRLVRRVCRACRNTEPGRCGQCGGTGLKGRTVTYEIARFSNRISSSVARGALEDAITAMALDEGMVPMQTHAQSLLSIGVTTRQEIARVIQLDGTV
ncbi:general secretion pathway protein E [Hoeflea marina]|uniref:General secretion pathway protein E n=1 Tax=Hoeflea marina TaxID=274592 RepID=A0A317PML6_9HYPH|nr:GspE/PulE family protein [Hoeflea marina]PWW01509.1 general secretion pathway protein E [Hoeflea marina]